MSTVAVTGTTGAASHGGEEVGEAVVAPEDMATGIKTQVAWLGPVVEHLVYVVGRSSVVAMETTMAASCGGEKGSSPRCGGGR